MNNLPFKIKRTIYYLMWAVGIASVVAGVLSRNDAGVTEQGFVFLSTGFVLLMVSWPFNTSVMRCKKCRVPFNYVPQNSPYARVLRKYKAFNYLIHLRTLTHCQNEKCGCELE